MPVSLADALLLAVAPALAGVALALLLLAGAWRDLAPAPPPDARGRLLVLAALPLSAPVLALVAALLAQGRPDDAMRAPLVAVGAATFAQAAAQGALAGRGLRAVVERPDALGRALAMATLPEALGVAALAWVATTAGA